MSRARTYEGSDVEITFEPRRCVHAGRCVHGLPGVFDPRAKPWIDPDGASGDEIAAAVRQCPTGALSMVRRGDGATEAPDDHVSVAVVPNGPLHVRGNLEVGVPGQTERLKETRVALCRCGQSANKPFCDNSHLEASFVAGDLEVMPERAVDAVPEPGGATVTPRENASLFIEGTVRFTAADGTVGWISNPALCRCGLSSTRPFCDGSHKNGAFVAPGPA
jgi:CDGSH-type Zn-finger protein/uncharacterized Fe-S cluster protein YjdI